MDDMTKIGRPTELPDRRRLEVSLAGTDYRKLRAWADARGVSLAEAVRTALHLLPDWPERAPRARA